MSFFFKRPTINENELEKLIENNKNLIFKKLKQNMLEELETLDKLVKQYESKLSILKKKSSNILECSICFERNFNYCAIPCGHLYCVNCIENLDSYSTVVLMSLILFAKSLSIIHFHKMFNSTFA